MTARIISHTGDAPRELATLASGVSGEAVIMFALTQNMREHLESGIVGEGGRKLTLEDGDDFIRNLPFEFKGLVRAEVSE